MRRVNGQLPHAERHWYGEILQSGLYKLSDIRRFPIDRRPLRHAEKGPVKSSRGPFILRNK